MENIESKYKICYLCGESLSGDLDYDHVPPKQFYSEGIRKKFGPQLLTLPTHKKCNKSYHRDEDYFVMKTVPGTAGTR